MGSGVLCIQGTGGWRVVTPFHGRRRRGRRMENWAASNDFLHKMKVGLVRPELRCANVHECMCINHEKTRRTVGTTIEGTYLETNKKLSSLSSGHVSIRNED